MSSQGSPMHAGDAVAEALRATHWYELAEWTSSGPGSAALSSPSP